MNYLLSFDTALDRAIDAVRRGRPLDDVLAELPGHAAAMQPLLEVAAVVRDARPAPPRSDRLIHDYDVLRAAVERARMAAERPTPLPVPAAAPAIRSPWWRTRLAYFLFLFTLAGGSATVVGATTGLHDRFADLVAPGSGGSISHQAPVAPQEGAAFASAAATAAAEESPSVSVAGAVSDMRGNTFTLTNGADVWHVVLRADATVTGQLADGAGAIVSGASTGRDTILASEVAAWLVEAPAAGDSPASAPTLGAGINLPGFGGAGGGSGETAPPPTTAPPEPTQPPSETPEPQPTETPKKGPRKTPPGLTE
jgi:hypothetical protein